MRAKWRKKRVRRLKRKRRKTRARSSPPTRKLITHRNGKIQSRDQHTNSTLKEGSAPDGGLRWRTITTECGAESKDGIIEGGVTGSVYFQEYQKL